MGLTLKDLLLCKVLVKFLFPDTNIYTFLSEHPRTNTDIYRSSTKMKSQGHDSRIE